MANLLWTIIVIFIILWVLGLLFKIGGGIIHILLLIAGVIFIFQLIRGKRSL